MGPWESKAWGNSWQLWEQRAGVGPNLGTRWKWEAAVWAHLSFSVPRARGVASSKSLPFWMLSFLTYNTGGGSP